MADDGLTEVRYRQRPTDPIRVNDAEKRQLEALGLLVETTATTDAGVLRAAANTPVPGEKEAGK